MPRVGIIIKPYKCMKNRTKVMDGRQNNVKPISYVSLTGNLNMSKNRPTVGRNKLWKRNNIYSTKGG